MRIHRNNKVNRGRVLGLLPRIFKRYYKGEKISIYTCGTGKDAIQYTKYHQYRTELIFLVKSNLSGAFAVEIYDSALEAEIGHQKWIGVVEDPETTYTLTGGEHLSVNIPGDNCEA